MRLPAFRRSKPAGPVRCGAAPESPPLGSCAGPVSNDQGVRVMAFWDRVLIGLGLFCWAVLLLIGIVALVRDWLSERTRRRKAIAAVQRELASRRTWAPENVYRISGQFTYELEFTMRIIRPCSG